MESIAEYARSLSSASTTEDELASLVHMTLDLEKTAACYQLSNNSSLEFEDDALELRYLQSATYSDGNNPFPLLYTLSLFSKEEDLHDFVAYLFLRRYGWSETLADENVGVSRIKAGGQPSVNEASFKAPLNKIIDDYIAWLSCQPVTHVLLASFKHAVVQAASRPVMRKQLIVHVMEWLTRQVMHTDSTLFDAAKDIIMASLSDCWSAVRSACAAKLGCLVDKLKVDQVESLFSSLIAVCSNTSSSWQAQEGAITAINVIIRRFHWVELSTVLHSTEKSTSKEIDAPNSEYFLRFGQERLTCLPDFISIQVYSVVYLLLRHQQLSIRERAIKAFSSYLSRCEFKDVLSSLKEVVTQLQTGSKSEPVIAADGGRNSPSEPGFMWMDAYAAEGLLGVCVFLVKLVPPDYLLPRWPLYFSTFSLYLMHPASTVRQATSAVFKHIVAKDPSKPRILQLVLQGLSCDWHVEGHSRIKLRQPHACGARVPSCAVEFEKKKWEYKEGRLLTYELLLHFLNKDHRLHAFGDGVNAASTKNWTGLSASFSGSMGRLAGSKETMSQANTYAGSTLKDRLKATSAGNYKAFFIRTESGDFGSEADAEPLSEATSSLCSSQNNCHDLTSRTFESAATKAQAGVQTGLNCMPHQRYVSQCTQLRCPVYAASDDLGIIPTPVACSLLQTSRFQCEDRNIDSFGENRAAENSLMQPTGADENQNCIDFSMIGPLSVNSLGTTFNLMFHQTVECIASSKWELRRMGQQVLPCLAEALRWYDIASLEAIWEEYTLPPSTESSSSVCYGACLSFLLSLCHGLKLRELLRDHPASIQNASLIQKEAHKVIECIFDRQLPRLLPRIVSLLQRPTIDKLTAVAVQIVALGCGSSNVTENGMKQHCCSIVSMYSRMFSAVHQGSSIVQILNSQDPPFCLPTEEFLSCCSHESEKVAQRLECAEKYVVTEVSSSVLSFVKHCSDSDLTHLWPLLPVWTFLLCNVAKDDHVRKVLFDSILVLLWKVNPCHDAASSFDDDGIRQPAAAQDDRTVCLSVICSAIVEQTADVHLMRLLLELLTAICLHPEDQGQRHLGTVLKCLGHQLRSSQQSASGSKYSGTTRQPLPVGCTDSPAADLEILSNDIQLGSAGARRASTSSSDSMVDIQVDSLGSTVDDNVYLMSARELVQTTLLLGAGRSRTGSMQAADDRAADDRAADDRAADKQAADNRAVTPASSARSRDSSAWDSWDESEEETESSSLLSDYAKKLVTMFTNLGRRDEVLAELRRLPESDRQLLQSVLGSW